MKAIVIMPKDKNEFRFLQCLLEKLDATSSTIQKKEIEDFGLSTLLKNVDKTKR